MQICKENNLQLNLQNFEFEIIDISLNIKYIRNELVY